jgi:DNA-binding LytR/AlgR family response regulator
VAHLAPVTRSHTVRSFGTFDPKSAPPTRGKSDDLRPSNLTLRTMIVSTRDDEVRLAIRDHRGWSSSFTVAAEVSTVAEIAALVVRDAPDLLLLDIALADDSGLDLVQSWSCCPEAPQVIVIADSDCHAVRAFEIGVLDYLVKPLESSRLRTALARAIKKCQLGSVPLLSPHPLTQVSPSHGSALDRVVIASGGRLLLVDCADIY